MTNTESRNATTGDRKAQTAAHTPGPWTVSVNARDEWPEEYAPIDGADWLGLAQVVITLDGEKNYTAQANARLIAAAPTMFDYIAARAVAGDIDASKIIEDINANS